MKEKLYQLSQKCRDYYEQLYINKLENLDKFSESYLILLTQELKQKKPELTNHSMEIETVVKSLPKNQRQDGFSGDLYQTFKEEQYLSFSKSFKNN